jgi:dipeptidase E
MLRKIGGRVGVIILASSGSFLTEGDLSFLPRPVNEMKIAHVITASKSVPSTSYIKRHQEAMEKLGCNVETVDIEGKDEAELLKILSNKDMVFVDGGNTFYLIKAIRGSGFDGAMRKLLEKGVVYLGASAGSYVACPTMEMATWKGHNKYDRHGVSNFSGMNLVPFLVFAHYERQYEELVKRKIEEVDYPVKILTDNQAVLVEDGVDRIITKNKN